MKTNHLKFIITIALILLMNMMASAQIFNKIKDKVKQKAEQKAEQTVNKSIEKPRSTAKNVSTPADEPSESKSDTTDEDKIPECENFVDLKTLTFPPKDCGQDVAGQKYKVGRILFSKDPIYYGKEEKNQIQNEFKAGDEVYAMAYFGESRIDMDMDRNGIKFYLHDLENGAGFVALHEYKSVTPYTTKDGKSSNDYKYYDIDVFTSPENAYDKNIPKSFLTFLKSHLDQERKAGKKVYKFELVVRNPYEVVARGVFSYDLTGSSEKIDQWVAAYDKDETKNGKLPPAAFKDAALENKIKIAYTKYEEDPIKKVILNRDWSVVRNELSGAIMYRSIGTYIVKSKPDGTCVYIEVNFRQQYIGGKFSNEVEFLGHGFGSGTLLCENVK